MKQKILSLLVLLLTAASGAWAQSQLATEYKTSPSSPLNNVTVSEDMDITIASGVTVFINDGLTIASGKTLTVRGAGTLVVNGANGSEGDHGDNNTNINNNIGNGGDGGDGGDGGTAISGNIIVKGATVVATGGVGGVGGDGGAGANLGGNDEGDYPGSGGDGGKGGKGAAAFDGTVIIYSGSITANGGYGGDGGYGGSAGNNAKNNNEGAQGYHGNGGNGANAITGTLTFYGGKVEAQGGNGGNGAISGTTAKAYANTSTVTFENAPTTLTGDGISDITSVTAYNKVVFSADDTTDPNDPIELTPVAGKDNQWEFDMVASDVLLTPIYSAATLRHTVDETIETLTPYETLKEAFAHVQDGDVITLDWNVELEENLSTPTTTGGVQFTIDFNGYTLDCGQKIIGLINVGDQLTFTDNSNGQMGGLICESVVAKNGAKFIFDSGRYNISSASAEVCNTLFPTIEQLELADGKEFIDLAGGAEANNGFLVRVDYQAFELTIGAGRFATFYADKNVKLDAETPAGVGLYTINGFEEDSETGKEIAALVVPLTGVVEAGTPMLVYNGTNAEQTVKIIVSPDDPNTANEDITPIVNFKGTAVDNPFSADDMLANNYYALSGGKAFAPVYDAGTLPAHKCWLEFPKPQANGARTITISFGNGDTTGLKAIDNGQLIMDNDDWYDLNGRKLNVAPKRKGVYIQNGKKVVK